MKKLTKILLSLCMAFVLSLSLVACDGLNDNDNDDGTGDSGAGGGTPAVTYTPPEGVDMTSMADYVNWLIENGDTSKSYEGTISIKENGVTKTETIKSVSEDDDRMIAKYNSEGEMIDAVQISKKLINWEVLTTNFYSRTYTVSRVNLFDSKKTCANIHCAYGIVMMPYQIEINQGYDIGTDITTIPGYEDLEVTETVTNPSTGKYVLTRTIATDRGTIVWQTTVLQDRVVKFEMESTAGNEMSINYEYKNVSIDSSILEEFQDADNLTRPLYTPPEGVDMNSMSAYVNWLVAQNNTKNYEGTIKVEMDGNVDVLKIKSEYRDAGNISGRCVVQYDSENKLKEGLQVQINSGTKTLYFIDAENKTYRKSAVTSELDIKKSFANIYCAYGIMLMPYQIELNQGYDIGTAFSFIPGYESVTVTETVENPQLGKYIYTRTLNVQGVQIKYQLVVFNNLVIGFTMENTAGKMEASYTYKDNVSITEDFSDYTEV